jgi:nucleoside-diphosphate-sugar epimerase
MPSFLITGASGFIGYNLAEFLARRGHQVRCLVRKDAGFDSLRSAGCDICCGSLEDESSLKDAVGGVDYVIHLAGMTAALSRQKLLEVNGEFPGRVAQACARLPTPPTLVHVSSVAASGPIERGKLRVEIDPCAPVSEYGESKLAGEREVQKWGHELPITILRPGAIFGPRDSGMLPIYKAIRRLGLHAVPAFKPPPVSYLYVEDLCELIERAALRGERLPGKETNGQPKDPGQGIYFAVAPEHPDYGEFGLMIAPLVGRPRTFIFNMPGPLPLLLADANQLIARFKGRPDQFSRDKIREGRASSWACSHLKAAEQLDFLPARSLRERLEQTVAWYREQKWL